MEYLVNPTKYDSPDWFCIKCDCKGEWQCSKSSCPVNGCDSLCTGRYCRAPGAEPQSSSSLNKY